MRPAEQQRRTIVFAVADVLMVIGSSDCQFCCSGKVFGSFFCWDRAGGWSWARSAPPNGVVESLARNSDST